MRGKIRNSNLETRVSNTRADTKRYAILIMRIDKLITCISVTSSNIVGEQPEAMEIKAFYIKARIMIIFFSDNISKTLTRY